MYRLFPCLRICGGNWGGRLSAENGVVGQKECFIGSPMDETWIRCVFSLHGVCRSCIDGDKRPDGQEIIWQADKGNVDFSRAGILAIYHGNVWKGRDIRSDAFSGCLAYFVYMRESAGGGQQMDLQKLF
jgi:hypothetical protein